MPNKELTIENLGEEIKCLIEKATGKHKGGWFVHKLKNCGFGLQINIMLTEEENLVYSVIERKPIYHRRPKSITVSTGFTAHDLDFFQKYKILPPHEPSAIKQPEEENLLLRIKGLIMGILDGKTGCYQQLMLQKYGTSMRVYLMAVQEDNPQLIIRQKTIRCKIKKIGADFTAYDQDFLQKNRLIGF